MLVQPNKNKNNLVYTDFILNFDCVESLKLINTLWNPFLEPASAEQWVNGCKVSCSRKPKLAPDRI
jgi:hypothetical protein